MNNTTIYAILPTMRKFISDTKAVAAKHNISVIMSPEIEISYPYDGTLVSGYFDANDPIRLAIACGRDDWLDILVHESCHMDQFIEQCPEWTNGVDSVDRYFDWINGIDIPNVEESIHNAGLLELDCEIRSLKKIKQYDLPIDCKQYAKRANAYTLFYLYTIKTRKWYSTDTKPYDIKEIVDSCSDELHISKYDLKYHPNVVEMFDKYYS